MTGILPHPDSLPLPLTEDLAYALNIKKCGLHATGKFWIAQGLILPISIAILTIISLGVTGVISHSIVGWGLCGIGCSVFISNLVWGQIKYRKTLFGMMTFYSLAIISLGAVGGMGLLPVLPISMAILATYFLGTACICYGMGYSASTVDERAHEDLHGDIVAAGRVFPAHLREVYDLHGSNEGCPFCTSCN